MHSFPHQISDLDKLFGALKVVSDLVRAGNDVADDETLGVALATAGIYTFRGNLTLAQALAREKTKIRANRGTETAARDLRRLFSLMNLIVKTTGPSRYVLTAAGTQLLASKAGDNRQAQWRSAMLNLSLETEPGRFSHPYKIITRLVTAKPGIEKQKLLLALEANDDTDAEFSRIDELADLTVIKIIAALGVSESNAANSIKILPSIAQQLGDIIEKGGKCFSAPITLITEEGTVAAPQEPPTAPKILAEVTPETIAESPAFTQSSSVVVDLTDAIATRKARTIEHNKAVKLLASVLHKAKFKLHEFPYDCLAIDSKNRTILAEVKTLDGSPVDERQQSERAIGQLKGYRFFSLPDKCNKNPLVELAAFTRKPAQKTIDFLKSSGIETIWLDSGNWKILDSKGAVVDFTPELLL